MNARQIMTLHGMRAVPAMVKAGDQGTVEFRSPELAKSFREALYADYPSMGYGTSARDEVTKEGTVLVHWWIGICD